MYNDFLIRKNPERREKRNSGIDRGVTPQSNENPEQRSRSDE